MSDDEFIEIPPLREIEEKEEMDRRAQHRYEQRFLDPEDDYPEIWGPEDEEDTE